MEISAPPMPVLQVYVFKESRKPFLVLLNEYGVAYKEPIQEPNVIIASGFIIDILQSSVPWAASLATVICAFLRNRRCRKVIIKKNDRSVIHCEGLSQKEIESVLLQAKSLMVLRGFLWSQPIQGWLLASTH